MPVELPAHIGAHVGHTRASAEGGSVDGKDLVESLGAEVRESGRGEQAHEEQLVEHVGLEVEGVGARGGGRGTRR